MAKLYIVGTPIGNLGDITLRAIDTLKMVDTIACEDTRTSLKLLNNLGISKRLIAYHKFNEVECSASIAALVRDGKDVALITDAGMPAVSDPGAEVVALCRKEGVDVESVPGPTAVMTAFALSGIKSHGFTFLGFLPDKRGDKVLVLSKYAASEIPVALYVAPHDLLDTVAVLKEVFGDRTVYVARELTKLHECVTVTSLGDFHAEEKGEIVLIVEGKEQSNPLCALTVAEHLKHYVNLGMDKKEAVKTVASDRNIPKNDVYKEAIGLEL